MLAIPYPITTEEDAGEIHSPIVRIESIGITESKFLSTPFRKATWFFSSNERKTFSSITEETPIISGSDLSLFIEIESTYICFPLLGKILKSGSKILLKDSPKSFNPEKALNTINNEHVAIKITKTARLLIRLITV